MRAESISTRLRRSISAGEYSPGEKLNEVAVAQKMGVSRNTLRESFSTLTADGILERIPNRGVFIASPTAEEVLGLFRERAIIEPGALLWGDALDVDVLDRIVTEAEASLEEEEKISTATTATLARMNQIFHRTVVQAVGSSLLNEEMDRLLARMRLVFLTIEHTRPTMHGEFVPINRKIVSLLRCGDRAGAADTLRKSLVETGDSMSALLQVPVYTAAPTVVPD